MFLFNHTISEAAQSHNQRSASISEAAQSHNQRSASISEAAQSHNQQSNTIINFLLKSPKKKLMHPMAQSHQMNNNQPFLHIIKTNPFNILDFFEGEIYFFSVVEQFINQ